jgi:hypothetical protein
MNYTATLNMVAREMPKELNFDRQTFLLCWIFLLFMLMKYYSQVLKEVWLLFWIKYLRQWRVSKAFRLTLSRKVGIITPFDAYLSVFYEISGLLFRKKYLVLGIADMFSELDL